jgi:hypothetical protein
MRGFHGKHRQVFGCRRILREAATAGISKRNRRNNSDDEGQIGTPFPNALIRRTSSFDVSGFTVDAVGADPAVDVAAVVADLEAGAVDAFDEVKVIAPTNFDEHDVVGLKGGWVAGLKSDEVAVVDFAAHGMAAWADFNGFAFAEGFDGEFGPAHSKRSCPKLQSARMKAMRNDSFEPQRRA